MDKSSNVIIMEMLEFIYREGGHPRTWHVGVIKDPRRRLFDELRLHYQQDPWIYRTAASEGDALRVQMYFHELGLEEGEEEWQPGARMVYAYRNGKEPFMKVRPRAVRAPGNGRGSRPRSIMTVMESVGAPEMDRSHETRRQTRADEMGL